MPSLLDSALDDLPRERNDRRSAPAPRRSQGGGDRPTPYARPAAGVEGNWKHDMYGKAPPRDRDQPRRTDNSQTSAKLVITNLHYEVSEKELELLFSQIGTIIAGPKIRFDRAGRSTGQAWVTYDTDAHAAKAMDAFDGAPAKGQPLTINYDLSYRPAPAPGSLLSRLGADASAEGSKGRDWDAPRPARDAPPRNAPTGPRGAGPIPSRGARGGRLGAAAGRGERPARVKQVPKTAADLDAELEAFMNQPAPDAAKKTEEAAAPTTVAPAGEGDVEMS